MANSPGFPIRPNLLPKSDPRYKKWKRSLKKRPPPWNKGKTKDTHPGVKKTTETFKKKGIDNFARWREKAKREGLIPSSYPPFQKNERLATLVGLTLGDGHIHKFPRTEKLTIVLGTDKPKLITYVEKMMEDVFVKKPKTHKRKDSNCVSVYIYQKQISERLNIPAGSRRYSKTGMPKWIWQQKRYLLSCLKGLFEADGSLCIHLPTYTYNFEFSNRNKKLLDDVCKGLITFGFHPEIRPFAIRLRKKKEVKSFKELINFREYNAE